MFSVVNQTLLEDLPNNKSIELPDKIKEYINYNPTNNTNLSHYHSGEQSFISYFTNVDVDAVFENQIQQIYMIKIQITRPQSFMRLSHIMRI